MSPEFHGLEFRILTNNLRLNKKNNRRMSAIKFRIEQHQSSNCMYDSHDNRIECGQFIDESLEAFAITLDEGEIHITAFDLAKDR